LKNLCHIKTINIMVMGGGDEVATMIGPPIS
jgi:hypothetical protein